MKILFAVLLSLAIPALLYVMAIRSTDKFIEEIEP